MTWKTPDKQPKTKAAGIEYLCGHPRYNTMNSWNGSSSFSRCIKVHHIDYPDKVTEDTAWEMLSVDRYLDLCEFNEPLDAWQLSHDYQWQWGTNGRSGGYVVMYHGFTKPGQYHSVCTRCGQRNCTKILPATPPDDLVEALRWCYHRTGGSRTSDTLFEADKGKWSPSQHYDDVYPVILRALAAGKTQTEIVGCIRMEHEVVRFKRKPRCSFDNKCGRCGNDTRVNYENPPREIGCYPGRDVYQEEVANRFADYDRAGVLEVANRFADYDRAGVLEVVDLVWGFDQAVDAAIANFVDYCRSHRVEDDTIMVEQPIKTVVELSNA